MPFPAAFIRTAATGRLRLGTSKVPLYPIYIFLKLYVVLWYYGMQIKDKVNEVLPPNMQVSIVKKGVPLGTLHRWVATSQP